MDKPPRTSFATDQVPAQYRYEVFREAMGVVYEVSSPSREGAEFNASLETTRVDNILLITCETVGQRFTRGYSQIARDGLEHFQIQVFSEGTNHVEKAVHLGQGSPRDLLFIDTAQRYQAYARDFKNHTLVVPRRRLTPKLLAPDEHHGRSLSRRCSLSRLAQDHLHRLFRQLPHLSGAQLEGVMEPTLELIAAAFNGCVEPDTAASRAVFQAMGDKVRAHIDRHLDCTDLSPEALCSALRLSRSTLYRLFEHQGGVAFYIRTRRLDQAMRLLSCPRHRHLTITEVANQVGFNSGTAFRRAFQRRFEVSPTDARRSISNTATAGQARSANLSWVDWYRSL